LGPTEYKNIRTALPLATMPLGWERLNTKTTSPNKNIVFIKPRPGPYENTAKDFLERIAAQCLPVMNKHSLAVASLEEYEPNKEFWGTPYFIALLSNSKLSQVGISIMEK
jgi:hypothetical protein